MLCQPNYIFQNRIALKYIKAKEEELKVLEEDVTGHEDSGQSQSVLEYFILESGLDKKDILGVVCDTLLAGIDTVIILIFDVLLACTKVMEIFMGEKKEMSKKRKMPTPFVLYSTCHFSLQGAFTLSYVLHNLATNPDKQELLAAEVQTLLTKSHGEVSQKKNSYIICQVSGDKMNVMTIC